MAKLKGPIQLTGSLGGLTFSQRENGIVVKEKTGTRRERIAKDPEYERTREQNQEFANANTAGSLIRRAFREVICKQDLASVNRLTARLTKVLHSDQAHARGERRVESGLPGLMEGFEFNESSCLHNRMLQPFRLQHDPGTANWQIDIDAFIPDCAVDAPKQTSCFRLLFAVTMLDMQQQECNTVFTQSNEIFYSQELQDPLRLELNIPEQDGAMILVLAGIRFYESIDGSYYPLDKGKHHCAAIIKARLGA